MLGGFPRLYLKGRVYPMVASISLELEDIVEEHTS